MKTIEIYKDKDKQIQVQVKFEAETVWLSQKLMAELFGKDADTIGLHLKNIYKEGELAEKVTTEYFSVVQQEGKRTVTRSVKFYNLDAIISVGYRVNSKSGTQFRQWATQRLKEYLVKGYTLNESRLKLLSGNLGHLEKIVKLLQKTSAHESIQLTEAKGLLDILTGYARSFVLLNRYDSGTLEKNELTAGITYEIKYQEAKKAIETLKAELMKRKEASSLFGNEKDDSFRGVLQNVIQTFDKQYLYPSIEEQAAHLLYFIIKNHPFSDGNKRIGALLFIWFLEKNRHQFTKSGELKINSNALTALALLVGQSDPNEKELLIKLIINLINQQ